MVYNGYYKVMSNIPKMGQLPTPGKGLPLSAAAKLIFSGISCCSNSTEAPLRTLEDFWRIFGGPMIFLGGDVVDKIIQYHPT